MSTFSNGFLFTPVSDAGLSTTLSYMNEIDPGTRIINVYMDIQNISTVYSNVELYMQKPTLENAFNDILSAVAKLIDFYISNNYRCHVWIYYDDKKNLFNHNLIPQWKENRVKSLTSLSEKDQLAYTSIIELKKMLKLALKSLAHIVNTSNRASIVCLEYIDSDFFPALIKQIYKDTKMFHLLISTDHDYIHMINDDYTFRYNRAHKKYYENMPLIETVYNRNLFIKYKLKLKTNEQAIKAVTYYQILHALGGDGTDSVTPIVPRYGFITWLKKLSDSEPVDIVIDKIFKKEIEFEKITDIDEITKRLFIFDFEITAKLFMYYMVDEEYKDKYNCYIEKLRLLSSPNLKIVEDNVKIVSPLFDNAREKPENIEDIFNQFKINKNVIKYLWI